MVPGLSANNCNAFLRYRSRCVSKNENVLLFVMKSNHKKRSYLVSSMSSDSSSFREDQS